MNETIREELADAELDFINTVIAIADGNNVSRDALMVVASKKLAVTTIEVTFKEYHPEKEPNRDKHWSECRQIALYDDQIRRMQEHIDRLKSIIDGLCGYVGGEGK